MILDLLLPLTQLVSQLWQEARNTFFVGCASGAVLAAISWWAAYFVALNVNRQFSVRIQHRFFCLVAALATLVFSILFVAFQCTGHVVEGIVTGWETSICLDEGWKGGTFKKAYEAVYNLRDKAGDQVEDFKDFPHPDTGRSISIPLNHGRSRRTVAETYAGEAANHFRDKHPFLSKILWARAETAEKGIIEDMERVFSENPKYPLDDAVRIAGKRIRRELKKQVPRIVIISRIALVIAFLFIQAIVFVLLIRAALADIRVNFSTQHYRGQ